jgi:hypothetical protein
MKHNVFTIVASLAPSLGERLRVQNAGGAIVLVDIAATDAREGPVRSSRVFPHNPIQPSGRRTTSSSAAFRLRWLDGLGPKQ